MNDRYRFELYVEMPNGKWMSRAFDVSAVAALESNWRRYDLCDDAVMAETVRGVTPLGAARIDTEPEKLAAEIAASLTTHIMASIQSCDLRNGYEQPNPQPNH